jgi:hypothetical protein
MVLDPGQQLLQEITADMPCIRHRALTLPAILQDQRNWAMASHRWERLGPIVQSKSFDLSVKMQGANQPLPPLRRVEA